jgi:hypothetical protein
MAKKKLHNEVELVQTRRGWEKKMECWWTLGIDLWSQNMMDATWNNM